MKYKKKPVIIDAIQWDGNNYEEICEFVGMRLKYNTIEISNDQPSKLHIPTLEGIITASVGDYIIKGIQGEFYPCKPDIFEKTYEPLQNIFEE